MLRFLMQTLCAASSKLERAAEPRLCTQFCACVRATDRQTRVVGLDRTLQYLVTPAAVNFVSGKPVAVALPGRRHSSLGDQPSGSGAERQPSVTGRGIDCFALRVHKCRAHVGPGPHAGRSTKTYEAQFRYVRPTDAPIQARKLAPKV
jgi:hypothetical protein